MESNLRYIIYTRKSSEARDRQALSIEAQVRELKEYAQRNGLQVVGEPFEESQSAFKLGRPIFDKMMRLFEEGVANAVLTWKPDRLARNAIDGGRVIQAVDDKVLLEIRTPYEIFRHEDGSRMMLYLVFGMSNDFSRQISSNVKRGNRQKYERGEFLGRAPNGYINGKIGISRNIIPDKEKAPLVRRMFEEYATGKYSVSAVAEMAQEWGLTSVTGKTLYKSEVYKLLCCPVYYGVYQHAKEFHQGSYEPLIDKELFDKVQGILRNKSKPRKQNWAHAYVGLMRCAGCGCAITATTKVKQYKRTNREASYTYYHCTKRRGKCSQPPITEYELEEMLNENLSKVYIDREIWELGIKLLKEKNRHELEATLDVRTKLELEFSAIEKKLSRLIDLRVSEEISQAEYAERKKIFIERKLRLKSQVEDREQSTNSWLELAEKFFETAFHAREVIESDDMEAKRELVRTVGWNLLLRERKLEFSFRKPYDILLQPEIRKNVQGRPDSNWEKQFWRLL